MDINKYKLLEIYIYIDLRQHHLNFRNNFSKHASHGNMNFNCIEFHSYLFKF